MIGKASVQIHGKRRAKVDGPQFALERIEELGSEPSNDNERSRGRFKGNRYEQEDGGNGRPPRARPGAAPPLSSTCRLRRRYNPSATAIVCSTSLSKMRIRLSSPVRYPSS
eukprot:scaffold281683_cov32-Tisochrysis_lutea.AAC.2